MLGLLSVAFQWRYRDFSTFFFFARFSAEMSQADLSFSFPTIPFLSSLFLNAWESGPDTYLYLFLCQFFPVCRRWIVPPPFFCPFDSSLFFSNLFILRRSFFRLFFDLFTFLPLVFGVELIFFPNSSLVLPHRTSSPRSLVFLPFFSFLVISRVHDPPPYLAGGCNLPIILFFLLCCRGSQIITLFFLLPFRPLPRESRRSYWLSSPSVIFPGSKNCTPPSI